MNSTEIRQLALAFADCKTTADFLRQVRNARYSSEVLAVFAQLETAAQLAEANEREAEKKKEYHWDFTQSPPTKIGPASPVPLLPAFPYPHYEPRYPSTQPLYPTITCSKPLASGSTACQSDWIQTTTPASTIEAEGKISD